MTKRSWPAWVLYGLCAAVVCAAMLWLTRAALELDRARAEAERKAVLEENVRLALWRMDSALVPLLARVDFRLVSFLRLMLSSQTSRSIRRMQAVI